MKTMLLVLVISLVGCKRIEPHQRQTSKEVVMYCVPANQFEARYEN